MEQELLWREAFKIRVFYKSVSFWSQVSLLKVRQGSISESIRNPLSTHVLLPNTSDNLTEVHIVPLGSSLHHSIDIVSSFQAFSNLLPSFVDSIIECCIDVLLESLHNGLSRLSLDLTPLCSLDQLTNFNLSTLNYLLDFLHGFRRSNCVFNSYRVTGFHEPIVDNPLHLTDKTFCFLGSTIQPYCVYQASCFGSHCRLVKISSQKLPLDYFHNLVVC
mmetsp:Transcript_23042/g.37119  ORF Transcript_23042/g.37119 Transcript_23042/m.37119 type:complete len:218 (-) Transcript_23042:189-842(-)